MYVRLLKHFAGHKPGRILCMSDGAANALLQRPGKIAEPVAESSESEPEKPAKPEPKRKR